MSHAQRLTRHRLIYVLIVLSAPVWVRLSLVPLEWYWLVLLARFGVIGAGLVYLVRGLRRSSGTKSSFDVDGGGFGTRSDRSHVLLLWILAIQCPGLSLAGKVPLLDFIVLAVFAVIVIVGGLALWRDLPLLELRPEGVRLRNAVWRPVEIPENAAAMPCQS